MMSHSLQAFFQRDLDVGSAVQKDQYLLNANYFLPVDPLTDLLQISFNHKMLHGTTPPRIK